MIRRCEVEEGVEEGEEVVMEGVGGEREACGPSKFSNPRTSRDKLQLAISRYYSAYL